MQIDKAQIISLLQQAGNHDTASQADSELPDQVDTDQHAGLLYKLGIDVGSLLGGGGIGGSAVQLGV